MVRKYTPVAPVMIEYECDNCKEGILSLTGRRLGAQYEYECLECNDRFYYFQRYPTVKYEVVKK